MKMWELRSMAYDGDSSDMSWHRRAVSEAVMRECNIISTHDKIMHDNVTSNIVTV